MSLYEQGVDLFNQPRQEGDIDLVIECEIQLLRHPDLKPFLDKLQQDTNVSLARTKRPEPQKFLLNQFWTQTLMNIPNSPISVRYWLTQPIPLESWLEAFNLGVIPYLLKVIHKYSLKEIGL